MIKKPVFLFLILFLTLLYPTTFTSAKNSQQTSQIPESTFFGKTITITPANISKATQNDFFVGDILGGNTIYKLNVGMLVNANLAFSILFTRDSETYLFSFDKTSPGYSGEISYSRCCSNVLKPLTFTIKSTSSVQNLINSDFNLFISYSIFSKTHFKYLVSKYQISSVNVLGYPYPPRTFIIGLMILLLGTLPAFFLDRLILRFLRK